MRDHSPPLRRTRTFDDVAAQILARTPRRGATRVVAVDGGSAAGKSTLAGRLARTLGASVVHTDDVAWHHSFFDWWPLLIEGVLEPLAAGRTVEYRPPAWDARERPGAVTAEPNAAVVIEGVGVGRSELEPWRDFSIWVDTDRQVALERGLSRPGEDPGFWRTWEAAEEEHLARDRPWERADLLISHDPPTLAEPERMVAIVDRATWSRSARPDDPRLRAGL